MDKIISDEITKYLLVLGGGAVALYVVFSKMITKVKGAFKPFRKQTVFYLLSTLIIFSLTALAAYPDFFRSAFNNFLFFQVFFLLMGSAHVYYMQHYIKWSNMDKTFVPELLFTALVCVVGCIGFLLVYRLVNNKGMEYYMLAGSLFFIIPFFFYNTFIKAISVPPKIVKEWFYPVQEEPGDPDEAKLKNLLVISFEFRKKIHDVTVTNFRSKAPADMNFGELFYYFINDYNERHPDSKVEFVNREGEPNGWIFFKKPRWYTLLTNYIDADKTIFNNRIRENDVIVCTRSLI